MTILLKCRQIIKRVPNCAFYNDVHKMSVLSSDAIILGIETSCDDTGCAVLNSKGKLLGESLYTQNIVHLRYGGVNPLLAHELHRDNIEVAVSEALNKANLDMMNIDAIAVTIKPGLLISLHVGVKYARYLARKYHKVLIPIHHMEAHALVARMYQDIPFPYIVLLISGGHCLLALVNDVDDFILLGKGLDNAPGEVFDKVARRMKLRNISIYSKISGGQAVELAAQQSTNIDGFTFPLPLARNRDCNFSFSGLKDSMVRKLLKKESEHGVIGDGVIPEVNDLCASFQLAVAEHLAHRTERAIVFCEKNKMIGSVKNIVVSGGVACNNFIYKSIELIGSKYNYTVCRPPRTLCTDNGVMIAWNGLEKLKKQIDIRPDIPLTEINPVAPLGQDLIYEVVAANLPVKVTRLNKMYEKYYLCFFKTNYIE